MASSIARTIFRGVSQGSSKNFLRTTTIRGVQQFQYSTGKSYDNILVETTGEKNNVGLIRLNRPKALNALCNALFDDLEDIK